MLQEVDLQRHHLKKCFTASRTARMVGILANTVKGLHYCSYLGTMQGLLRTEWRGQARQYVLYILTLTGSPK